MGKSRGAGTRGMRWFAPLLIVAAGAIVAGVARADENSITETSHFVTANDFTLMPKDQQNAYAMGAFDGFLFGMAAAKAGCRPR